MIGQTISHYRIVEKLGEGGQGIVYRAEDLSLHREVALKFLPGDLTRQTERRSRFLREARMAAALNHPNINTVYEVGEIPESAGSSSSEASGLPPGTPFIAMELVSGISLHDLMGDQGALRLKELLDIGLQIAEGLSEAHSHKILHRDLKPGNVMISSSGRVKILDFGLAKPLSPAQPGDEVLSAAETFSAELTREGKVVGTVAYMSPEQALGKPLDSRSDIFSFGTMLYEMSTGKKPFLGEATTSTLAKILEAEPAPLSEATPELPGDLGRIVHRCLQKHPDDRYNDTRDLVVDLRELQLGVTSGTTRRSTAPMPRRSRRTAKLALGVAATVATALATILVLSSLDRGPSSRSPATHEQLTFTGDATYPAISPDGSFIAYVTGPEEAEQAVMVMDLAGGQALEVFRGRRCGSLRWSPDGSELLFRAERDSELGVYIVPRLGGAFRRFGGAANVAWSPDGSEFVAGWTGGKQIGFRDKSTGTINVVTLTAPFAFLMDLDWSPSGDWLLFLTIDEQERYAISSTNRDGSLQRTVIESSDWISSPRWSSRGDAIYYLLGDGQTKDLYRLAVSTDRGTPSGDPFLLQAGLQAGPYFTVSDDGKRLLYTRALVHSNLWLGTIPGNGEPSQTKQLTRGTFLTESARISPDGTQLAFSQGDGRRSNIFVMPIEGGSKQQLTFLRSLNLAPVWSPDGRTIAFASSEGGHHRVWTVSSTGGNARAFPRSEVSGNTHQLAWSPGARILYHRPGNRNFHLLDPETEEERPLVEDDTVGWMFEPHYSPDGKSVVVYWNRSPSVGVWVIPLDDSSPFLLAEGYRFPIGWSPGGESVYVIDRTGKEIEAVSVSGGDTRRLLTLPSPAFDEEVRLSTSPDGRQFVASVYETQSDVWMADDFDPEVR